jgi:hypothetical protein
MQRTMKKLLMIPVLALTVGLVACESNPTAPALQAPAAPSANLVRDLGGVIGRDTTDLEAFIMGAPLPPPPGKYDLLWP